MTAVLIYPENDPRAVPVAREWQIDESAAPGSVGHLVGTGEEFLVDSLQKRPWPHLKVWVDRKTFEKLMSNDQYGLQPAA
jgi:hypothetical protein